jgi:septum formation protein
MSLILASASPRRAQLLEQIGVAFTVCPQALDESRVGGESPADYVTRLARAKAQQAWAWAADDSARVALGADTIVTLDDDLLGKPDRREAAIEMLLRLSNRTHEVLTGVAVASGEGTKLALNRNVVRFCPISLEQAQAYWATGEPVDKAGGYAIQGMGGLFVEYLQGSYSGVVGLPLFETAVLLRAVGIPVLAD